MMDQRNNGGLIALMNAILHKSMQAQDYPIPAQSKDIIKKICETTFDMMVKETDPMHIARLQFAAEQKVKLKND